MTPRSRLCSSKLHSHSKVNTSRGRSVMRLKEVVSAEELLGLWKLISDNVWTAINTQGQQPASAPQAETRRTAAAGKPKRIKPKAKPIKIPKPVPPPKQRTPPVQAIAKPQQQKPLTAQQVWNQRNQQALQRQPIKAFGPTK